MLKHVFFKNFVHFREHQHLSFKNGPNYILGANSTGKSSIFELIRRCLSTNETKSSSNIPEHDKEAYIFCEYEIDITQDTTDQSRSSLGDGSNLLQEKESLLPESDTADKKQDEVAPLSESSTIESSRSSLEVGSKPLQQEELLLSESDTADKKQVKVGPSSEPSVIESSRLSLEVGSNPPQQEKPLLSESDTADKKQDEVGPSSESSTIESSRLSLEVGSNPLQQDKKQDEVSESDTADKKQDEVGPSSKSSTIESTRLSLAVGSNPLQQEEPLLSESDTADKKQYEIAPSSESSTIERFTRKLYSGLFVERSNCTPRKMFKVSCLLPRNKGDDEVEVHVESMIYSSTKWNEKCDVLNTTNSNLVDTLKETIKLSAKYQTSHNKNKEKNRTLLELEVTKVFEKLKTLTRGSSDRTREDSLQCLTDVFVHVYPIRSLGRSQWSKSKSLLDGDGRNNYSEADENAEILNTLLDSSDVDRELANNIFGTLTSPLTYDFVRNDKTGEYLIKYNGVNQKLLKTPDGIIAAKQISLLLAHKVFKTICFEEIDQGMNPRMIEILRNLVLRSSDCQKKIIIFISHNPAMVGNWTLDRTFFCRRNELNKEKECVSHYVSNVFDEDALGYGPDLKREIKYILFASSVLFVEGSSDKFLIELIFDEIMASKDMELKEKICGMYIAVLGGKTQHQNARKFAKRLSLKYMCLLDKDLVFGIKEKEEFDYVQNLICCLESSEDDKEMQKMIKTKFENHTEKREYEIKKKWEEHIKKKKAVDIKDLLKQKRMFLWEIGNLDEMIFNSIIKHDNLQDKSKTELMLNLFEMTPRVYLSVDSRKKLYACLKRNSQFKEVRVVIGEDGWRGTLKLKEKGENNGMVKPNTYMPVDLSKQSLDTLRKVTETDEGENMTHLIIHTKDPDTKEKFKLICHTIKVAKDKINSADHCSVMKLDRESAETLVKCLYESEEINSFKTFIREMI